MKTQLLTLCLLLPLAGCATPVTHATQSGKPEATIRGSESRVRKELTNLMMDSGYRVTKSDDTTIVFEKPITNTMAQFALASRYDHQPVERSSFTIIDQGKTVRLIGDLAGITNPGSAFERRTDFNRGADSMITQAQIDVVKDEVEGK